MMLPWRARGLWTTLARSTSCSPYRCPSVLEQWQCAAVHGDHQARFQAQEAVSDGARPTPRRIYVKKVGSQGAATSDSFMLGLIHYFKRAMPDVAFFKPVGTYANADGIPESVSLMHHTFNMKRNPRESFALLEDAALQADYMSDGSTYIHLALSFFVQYQEGEKMLSNGKHDDLLELCYQKLTECERDSDLVLISGWAVGGFRFNAELAAHVDAPVLLSMEVVEGESQQSVYDRAMAEVRNYQHEHCQVLGMMCNSVPLHQYDAMHEYMQHHMTKQGIGYLGTYPEIKALKAVTIDQVYNTLHGRMLFASASEVQMGDPVEDVYIVTAHAGTMLEEISQRRRPLLVTTPDRVDSVCTAVAAHLAGVVPLAGIVVTDHDGTPSPYRRHLKGIFQGLSRLNQNVPGHMTKFGLPVFMTELSTYHAVQAIQSISPAVLPSSRQKIEAAFSAFEEYIDTSVLDDSLKNITPKVTPANFMHSMHQQCMSDPQRIVLPEAFDHRILLAADTAQRRGLARITLLGNPETVAQEASKIGVDLKGVAIVDPSTDSNTEYYVEELMEARRKKALAHDTAQEYLKDINYFGTMMVRTGHADGMVSGAAHTTAATIRPGMQVLKNPAMPLVSSVFFMCLPEKVLVYGDCAVNVDPTPEQLALIAIASAETAAAFGLEPRIAMLSYSTLGSGSGPQVEKVTKAVEVAREMRPDLALTGPMQYDAATNERVASVKVKDDAYGVAGHANVLIFPDLNTGNNTYKAVQQASGAIAIGPLMQGLGGAVNDLSRGCTVQDIVDTICATSLQAQFKKKGAAA